MFQGKTVLVTGAGSGIGRKAAYRFAEEGANVVISDIDREGVDKTGEQLGQTGAEWLSVVADVSSPEDVKHLIDETVKRFGRLDVACNNAGIGGPLASAGDYTMDDWDRVLNVNLRGQWLCMKEELRVMTEAGSGSIVNISSILGNVGFANAPAYVASKHGLQGLTKTAALEYSARGIRVNCVAPAFIETEMLERAGLTTDREARQSLIDLHPIGRLGRPEEVADAIVWISSDEASFVTGHTLLVDGGYTAQ